MLEKNVQMYTHLGLHTETVMRKPSFTKNATTTSCSKKRRKRVEMREWAWSERVENVVGNMAGSFPDIYVATGWKEKIACAVAATTTIPAFIQLPLSILRSRQL